MVGASWRKRTSPTHQCWHSVCAGCADTQLLSWACGKPQPYMNRNWANPTMVFKGHYLQRGSFRTSTMSFTHTWRSRRGHSPHNKPPQSEGCLADTHLLHDPPRSGTPSLALPQLCKAKCKDNTPARKNLGLRVLSFSLGEAESSFLLPGSWFWFWLYAKPYVLQHCSPKRDQHGDFRAVVF